MRLRRTSNRSPRRRSAGLATALAIVAGAFGPAAPALAADPGEVQFVRDARSDFDHWLTDSSESERAWIRSHYSSVRGYAPFYDRALGWAPKTHVYKDAYAIYNDRRGVAGRPDLSTMDKHPDWVLRDAQGNPLFLDFACKNGSCTQYAADIGNPEWRADWIADVLDKLDRGYAGVSVDDVNMEWRISNGNGDFVAPIDPRTGEEMTLTAWRGYFATFMEELRAATPGAEISQNPIWFASETNPEVRRQTEAADVIYMERGFNDRGIVGGTGKYSYSKYLAHVDWLHARGTSVIFQPYDLDAGSRIFEIASYLLVNGGGDAIMSDLQADPDNWWSGWSTDLGAALGDRYSFQGLTRRDFVGGIALTNEPGAPTRTVNLPAGVAWTDIDGNPVNSVTLGARQGAIVLGPVDPTAVPTQPAPAADDSSAPAADDGSAPAADDSSAKPRLDIAPIALKARKPRAKRGRKTALLGRASGARRVVLQVRRGSNWRSLKRTRPARTGRFVAKFRAPRRGIERFRAVAPGFKPSRVVALRVSR